MNMKTILKTSVAAAALMAFAAPVMAQSNIETGQSKVKLKVYGQVNKAMMWGDDGNNSRTMVVDNTASDTRIGFLATAPVNADFAFGANFEMGLRSNPSNGVFIQNGTTASYTNTGGPGDNAQNSNTWNERKAEVTMTHKRFGKVWLGQGDEANESISEMQLNGAAMVSGVIAANSYMGNTALFNKTTNAHITRTLGSVFTIIDSDRDDRIRYDTPTFMGFTASTSFTSGGGGQAALRYDNKLGQFKVNAGVGYTNRSGYSTVVEDEVAGSISVLHDTGLNASFSYGTRNNKATPGTTTTVSDTTQIGGSVGYIAKIFGVGPTSFSVDYYNADNVNRLETSAAPTAGWDTNTWGLGINQSFADIGTDVYLMYRNFEVNAPVGTSIDDVNVVVTGVRVTF